MRTATGAIMNTPGGGSSAIFGPDGRMLGGYLTPEQLLQALKIILSRDEI